MSVLSDYLRRLEGEDIPRTLENLQPLLAGEMKIGGFDASGAPVDETPKHIKHLEDALRTYKAIVADLKKRGDL